MLFIKSFTFNPFQENTYIIYNEQKECWIVDPGMYDNEELTAFNSFIEENQLQPQAIINTHTHIDHIFGVPYLIEKYKLPFIIHEKDTPVLKGASGSAMLFGFSFPSTPTPSSYLSTGILKLGNDEVEVKLTPGHSPGSVIFYYKQGNWLIGGDVLFNGSIGRSDLPGGDHDTLINSIKNQLLTLDDNTIVYSGHGPATTIGKERVSNPFLI